jgi:hypothetical protein
VHRGPLDSSDIYDNGPTNGNTDAWTINFGFIVSDSFNVTQGNNTSVTGMSFAAWMAPGDVLDSAEVSITSSENGGTSYFDQTVNFTQIGCIGNEFGYNVCTETASFNGPTLINGTYWVNLQNASSAAGDPVYWDENSGPSQASESTVGTIPSESFTIQGDINIPPPACFQPEGNLQVLYNFTQEQAGTILGSEGVTIDNAGNLYGATYNGGNNGAGFVYKLANFGSWVLDPLFSFLGGDTGSQPPGVIVGPNGSLYGGAQGGTPCVVGTKMFSIASAAKVTGVNSLMSRPSTRLAIYTARRTMAALTTWVLYLSSRHRVAGTGRKLSCTTSLEVSTVLCPRRCWWEMTVIFTGSATAATLQVMESFSS